MKSPLRVCVILPAAGKSQRFGAGGGQSKLDADLGSKPVLLRSVELFAGRPEVSQIIVAADPDKMDDFRFRWSDKLSFLGVKIVPGGRQERWETVQNALREVDAGCTHVAVHDAARPVTDPAMIDRIFQAAEKHPALIPAVRIHATVKRAAAQPVEEKQTDDPLQAILGGAASGPPLRRVLETVPRENLWMVQTPQVFERSLLSRAYEQLAAGRIDASALTDDAGLIEAIGEPVLILDGDPLNVKITVPEDLNFALAVQRARTSGGHDPLGPKRKFPTWAESEDE